MAAAIVAKEKAQTWQPDAVFIPGFRHLAAKQRYRSAQQRRVRLGFYLHSPAARTIASTSVADNVPNAIVAGQNEVALNPLDIVGGWKIDSAEAVRILMEQGGREFAAREGVTAMVMTMTTDNGNGRLEWLVGLFSLKMTTPSPCAWTPRLAMSLNLSKHLNL
ncbi:MAG: hypothetical protein M5U34_14430 [Chloroflexi bacterium]|nr:hypothetical protein [Chloroflexota bacterium]